MTPSSRLRCVGALLAVSVLTGCSLIGDETTPEGEPKQAASAHEQSVRDTGRPATNDLLAPMDSAPAELFTLPAADLDPQGECRESSCVLTWRPINADTVVVEGASASSPRQESHDFRTAVDLATGESLWSHAKDVPAGRVDAGEVCVGGSAEALVCVDTASERYAFHTISATNGEQVAYAPFAEAPTTENSTIVGMSSERRGDVLHVSVLLREGDAVTRTSSVHAATIAADGSIEWQNQSPASIGNGYLSRTHLLDGQLVITHVTTQDGEPMALSAETGDRVTMSSDNVDALTGITESARQFVDDGSAEDHRFRVDPETSSMQVLPAGDLDEEPLWEVPSDQAVAAVCGGVVAVAGEPAADGAGHTASARALTDGSELWDLPLTGNAAISCDGRHLLVADGAGLTALDPTTGEQAWTVEGPWAGARRIIALTPSGPSERFAVISADATGEETVTVLQAP